MAKTRRQARLKWEVQWLTNYQGCLVASSITGFGVGPDDVIPAWIAHEPFSHVALAAKPKHLYLFPHEGV